MRAMNGKSALRWTLALGYLAAIHVRTATGALAPAATLPPGVDKIVHVCQFGLLAWLLWVPWRATFADCAAGKAAAFIFILTALNGAMDELHQIWTPHRTAEWGDAAADAAGGGIAVLWGLRREKARPRAAAS